MKTFETEYKKRKNSGLCTSISDAYNEKPNFNNNLFTTNMKDLRAKHETCIKIIDLIIESRRTLNEMHWSNARNNEMGLKTYHTEKDINAQIRAINKLEGRYIMLTAKL
jgi:hypothetical protein